MPNNPITPTNEARANGTVVDASHSNDLASALNRIVGITSTVTAAGTTVLTVASFLQQVFTGTTTQIVTLPVTSTLGLGMRYRIINDSTGIVTVNSSGGNLIYAIPAGVTVDFICILLTGTTAASWLADYPAAALTAPNGVLGSITRNSASDLTTTSTTLVAIDTTNLRVTFTAPASGNVLVMCHAYVNNPAVLTWGILEGATTKGVQTMMNAPTSAASAYANGMLRITGLTPNASYTWDLAWKTASGTATWYGNSQQESGMVVFGA